jgi:hypothetical protein
VVSVWICPRPNPNAYVYQIHISKRLLIYNMFATIFKKDDNDKLSEQISIIKKKYNPHIFNYKYI